MPSLIGYPPADPRGQVDAADHEGDEDGRGVEAAPGAGADPGGASVRAQMLRVLNSLAIARRSVDAPAARRAPDAEAGGDAADRDHRGPRACAAASTPTSIKAVGRVHRREPGAAGGARPGRPPRPRLLRAAAASRCATSRSTCSRADSFADAKAIAAPAIEDFIEAEVDSVISSTTSSSR